MADRYSELAFGKSRLFFVIGDGHSVQHHTIVVKRLIRNARRSISRSVLRSEALPASGIRDMLDPSPVRRTPAVSRRLHCFVRRVHPLRNELGEPFKYLR